MINQKGEILIIAMAALGLMLFTILTLIAGAQIYFSNAVYSVDSEKATALAEAGIDKAVASFNKLGSGYLGQVETGLGDGSFEVTITTKDAGTKIIESVGYIPNKISPKTKRTIRVEVSQGVGVAFKYGVQVGEGGLEMKGGNLIKGSIYSNGDIIAIGGGAENEIEGDAWVAGGPAATFDQQTDCDGSNCIDYLFGKSISGETRLDIAQSFKPAITEDLNKVTIKIKKINNPPDVTVRILADDNGNPQKSGVLATGTLYSSLVTGSYAWIDVTFDSTPTLFTDNTYWLMIDTSSDSTNYWSWQNNLAQSYNRGVPERSDNWSASQPDWTAFNGDLSFKLYMGGISTKLDGADNIEIGGNVHANTIKDAEIQGDAYYQTIISSSVEGTSHPASEDPPPKVFPISEANVTDWKDIADGDGTNTSGPLSSCVSTLGPIKIEGDVNLHDCTITVKSPIWITGNLILENGNIFTLSPEYGVTSGVIVVDGKVEMKNNNHFRGTGLGSSLLMVLSNYDSKSNGLPAVEVKNNGNTGVFYAANGLISPGNGNTFKELTAWKISLVQNSIIDYEQGLSSSLFSSGPLGSYSLIKGTYQVK